MLNQKFFAWHEVAPEIRSIFITEILDQPKGQAQPTAQAIPWVAGSKHARHWDQAAPLFERSELGR